MGDNTCIANSQHQDASEWGPHMWVTQCTLVLWTYNKLVVI